MFEEGSPYDGDGSVKKSLSLSRGNELVKISQVIEALSTCFNFIYSV